VLVQNTRICSHAVHANWIVVLETRIGTRWKFSSNFCIFSDAAMVGDLMKVLKAASASS